MALYECASMHSYIALDGENVIQATRDQYGQACISGNFAGLPQSCADMLAYWLIGGRAIEAINKRDHEEGSAGE